MPSVIHHAITIGRPIEDVFAVVTDVEKTERWFPLKVKEWWTSEPPHGVGSTRRARVTIGWFTTRKRRRRHGLRAADARRHEGHVAERSV